MPLTTERDVGSGSPRNPTMVRLPSSLDGGEVEALRQSMLEALSSGADILVAASAPEQVSTAGVQAIISCARSARIAGVSFRMTEPSEALASAVAALGLETEFNRWIAHRG